jgi:hypothetical protein
MATGPKDHKRPADGIGNAILHMMVEGNSMRTVIRVTDPVERPSQLT